ncbi:MAG: prepilin-type N-terminal cleavage/methylation domain-containing protein [Verrucomicrobiae bacterium]|nr:prepilin-type N-terminal cleavage/methylation domain-containing protein [Verrucomicrobiae bacterium]
MNIEHRTSNAEHRRGFGVRRPAFAVRRSPYSPARGFTLVELILVMALMLAAVAMLAPSLGRFFRGRDLDSEARRFLSLTRYAQSRAVTEGVPMLLWVDPDRRAYGLTEEFSYTTQADRAAVSYELAKDLQIQVDPGTTPAWTQPVVGYAVLRPQLTRVTLGTRTLLLGRNTILFRFQPDGFIGETSPQSLWILREPQDTRLRQREDADQAVWITQDANRLNYVIQTNQFALVRR